MYAPDQPAFDLRPATEEEFLAELADLSNEWAPRRFTLCQVEGDREDAMIVGWGMAFDDEALAYLPTLGKRGGRSTLMRFSSAERARRFLSRKADIRLVWIDAPSRDEDLPGVRGGMSVATDSF